MAITRQNIRDYVRKELKIDPNGRVWDDNTLNRNIETARRKIQQDGNYDWHFNDGEDTSITTSIGTAEYTLPTGFVRLESVKYDTWVLQPTTKSYLKKTNSSLAVNGKPVYYYLLGSKIGLFQRPDEAKTLDFTFRKKLAAFTADTSVEEMDDEFIEAIVQYACYLSWADIQGREDKAVQAMQGYREAMEGLFEQFLGRRDDVNFNFQFETING